MMSGQGRVTAGSAAPAERRNCTWLNTWVFLIFALPIKAVFVTICLVALLDGSSGHYKIILQNSTEWYCVPSSSAEKVDGWTCCPKGWRRFQRSCYFLSPDTMSWSESEQNCSGMGSQLVVISSKVEQDFLSEQTKQTPNRVNFYIGLFEDKVGQWQWVDKTPYNVTAAFWREGEPSPGHDENCTVIYVSEPTLNNWNDVKPNTQHHRICEAAAVIV